MAFKQKGWSPFTQTDKPDANIMKEIRNMMSSGKSNEEIATYISKNSDKSHVYNWNESGKGAGVTARKSTPEDFDNE